VNTALITGIGGQDGLYLARYLDQLGYRVVGLLPIGTESEQHRVREVVGSVELCTADVTDTVSLARVIAAVEPDEIYNLAGISSVRLSWELPVRAADVNGSGLLRILEAVRLSSPRDPARTRVFQASSVQMFGAVGGCFREDTPIAPTSPYGAAKALAHFFAASYRSRYGMFVSCGILGNHESRLQDSEFLLSHVTRSVRRIAAGGRQELRLNSLAGTRDWGYAGDYVRAMHAMLQHERPEDFVIATGVTHSVVDVVRTAFAAVGMKDWRPYVSVASRDTGQTRTGARGDAGKARQLLGWTAGVSFEELIAAMVRDTDPA
jgi:GDPmannose 4,6-dehydratase